MALTHCCKETLVTYRVEGRNPGIALLPVSANGMCKKYSARKTRRR
jgi:hypothetical protein